MVNGKYPDTCLINPIKHFQRDASNKRCFAKAGPDIVIPHLQDASISSGAGSAFNFHLLL
jgi:hypothetical protein